MNFENGNRHGNNKENKKLNRKVKLKSAVIAAFITAVASIIVAIIGVMAYNPTVNTDMGQSVTINISGKDVTLNDETAQATIDEMEKKIENKDQLIKSLEDEIEEITKDKTKLQENYDILEKDYNKLIKENNELKDKLGQNSEVENVSGSSDFVWLSDLEYWSLNTLSFDLGVLENNLQEEMTNSLIGGSGSIDFRIDGAYTKLTGLFARVYNKRDSTIKCSIKIYFDGALKHEKIIKQGEKPIPINIDVTGVEIVRIEMRNGSSCVFGNAKFER